MAGLEAGDRRELYLALAFDRVVAGDVDFARLAATGAAGLAEPESGDARRAELYEAAAQVAGENVAAAADALEALDPAALSAADAELRAAALAVADQVQREPEPAQPAGADSGDLEASEVIERARDAIAAADALLERVQ